MKDIILARDKKELYYRYWPAQKEEKVLQLVHGANEHSGHYDEFARWMNKRGVSVYALDNRGHGLNPLVEGYIHINPEDWEKLPEDVILLGELIKEKTNKIPYLLGHSMGSFIARIVALKGEEYKGFFFLGTGWEPQLKLQSGLALAEGLILLHGDHYQGPLMERLIYEVYRREIIKKGDAKSFFGWFTQDPDKLTEAEEKAALIEGFSLGAFKSLLHLVEAAQETENISKITAPVHFLSGEKDPVGKSTRAVDQAYRAYKEAPFGAYRHIYPQMYHEILNDEAREEVYRDLLYLMQI
ncbi:MAG TPA: alpha/beta fold hydrolase [Clostridia bacterium]|nr:alpha/beta fold hydrolase [Clostridia bacterium]